MQGTKKAAQRELIRLLAEVENGTAVDPSRVTVAEYLRGWLDSDRDLSPKTLERYRQLVDQQIVPHLGATLLQKLRPAQVHNWHAALLQSGGKDGRPLSARTVGHAILTAFSMKLVRINPDSNKLSEWPTKAF